MHVGAGKTGSSSLQQFLCAAPPAILRDAGYVSCAATADGRLLSGDALVAAARGAVLGYVASAPALWELPDAADLRRGLEPLWAQGLTPVLSQEAWQARALQFGRSGLLEALDCRVDVVSYVRPQVGWLNAAWWQWFAWDGAFAGAGELVAARGHSMYRWGSQLGRWQALLRGGRLHVRLHGEDTVADFLRVLGVVPPTALPPLPRIATTPGPGLIALYRAVPGLRTVHGAETDARLRPLVDDAGPVPWVVGPALAASIVDALREDNERLAALMDAEQRARMRADARWWSVQAWQAHFDEQPAPPRPLPAACLALAERLLKERGAGAPPSRRT